MLKKVLPFVTLFCSLSTLICCALPALFVFLGAGATFVSLLGSFPQLIWFSENKAAVFFLAGVLLVVNFIVRAVVPKECPADPTLAAACARAQRVSNLIFYGSLAAYALGGFFAFVAPLLV